MSTTEIHALCGACKCDVEAPADPQLHDKVTCPRCGRTDRFDDVVKTIGEHVVHLTQQALAKRLAASTRGNSLIKMKVDKPVHRSFRWISDHRA